MQEEIKALLKKSKKIEHIGPFLEKIDQKILMFLASFCLAFLEYRIFDYFPEKKMDFFLKEKKPRGTEKIKNLQIFHEIENENDFYALLAAPIVDSCDDFFKKFLLPRIDQAAAEMAADISAKGKNLKILFVPSDKQAPYQYSQANKDNAMLEIFYGNKFGEFYKNGKPKKALLISINYCLIETTTGEKNG